MTNGWAEYEAIDGAAILARLNAEGPLGQRLIEERLACIARLHAHGLIEHSEAFANMYAEAAIRRIDESRRKETTCSE